MLVQIGTPARSRKPDEICPMVLTVRTRALSRPAAPSDTWYAELSEHARDRQHDAKETDAFDDARREQNEFVRCGGSDHIAKRHRAHPADQRPPGTQSADHDAGADPYRGPKRREDRHNQSREIE